MSVPQTNLSPDLHRLLDEGYELRISNDGSIIVENLPYLKADGSIGIGMLHDACRLIGGTSIAGPRDHTMVFVGELPCGRDGQLYHSLRHSDRQVVIDGVTHNGIYLSQKPQLTGKYENWYDKIVTYYGLIAGPAVAVDPSLRRSGAKVARTNPNEDVFVYPNNASALNGTSHLETGITGLQVAIIGLGGTGSHVLDHICKTKVGEIGLFDDDILETHNAFRGPGAASLEDLKRAPSKVAHYAAVYGAMRRGIEAYELRVDHENISLLDGYDFVFLCIDASAAKCDIVSALRVRNIPFIDTGIGAQLSEGKITGVLRSTIVEPNDDGAALKSVVMEPSDGNIYERNIQVSELNAMNACMAVMQFKIHFGYYQERPGSTASWMLPIGRHAPIGIGADWKGDGDAKAAKA